MPYVGKKPADIIATAVDTTTGTFSGEIDAASLDISGNIDVDGTTNLDNTDIDGTLNVQGETTLQTHLNMGDNDVIKLGAGNDFEVFSDGSNGVLKAPNLDLYLQSDSKIRLTSEGNSETLAIFNKDGAVELYHDNSQMFSTTTRGITSLSETTGISRYGGSTTVTLADDASINITNSGIAGSYIVSVYERGNGVGGAFFVTFRGTGTLLASGISGDCSASDTDGDLCLISASGSHSVTIKNRLGASKELFISIFAGNIGSS